VAKSTATLEAAAALADGIRARAYLSGTDYHGYASQWGAGVDAGGEWKVVAVGMGAHRSYRMPNLGELFLPAHSVGGRMVSGNKYLDAEHAWEGRGHVAVTWGALSNEIRWRGIRVVDPVAARTRVVGDATRVIPVNTGGALLHVFEDRLRVEGQYRGFEFRAQAAAVLTEGDRVGFFAYAPERRFHASARIGANLFEATSALYVGAEYVHGGERVGFSGTALPAYDVLNLTLDGRLLDADMYLALINVLDESYRTESDYLMTPRTFVYGIAWTLWE
jgi:hypothetical protein